MRDDRSYACADVGLEATKKVLPSFARKPTVHYVGGQKVEAMRHVQGTDCVAHALRSIDRRAGAGAGQANDILGVQVKLGVEELQAEPSMRIFGTKVTKPRPIIQWRPEVPALIRNIMKDKVGAAALFEAQIVILRRGDAGVE